LKNGKKGTDARRGNAGGEGMNNIKGQPYTFQKPELTAELKAFRDRLEAKSVTPLWEVFGKLATPEPRTRCVPAIWRYDEIRSMLLEAAQLITPKEAERRVLILENPGLRGECWITESLFAAVQSVLPGELARAHRHTASAFRFVLEGDGGGYTSVNGERTLMHPGDFVLTPSWTFHDHGNVGSEPTIWMDGLDSPFVRMMGVSFMEQWPDPEYPLSHEERDSEMRYGHNLLPVDCPMAGGASPIVNYPYARSRETVEQLSRNGPIDACHGTKLRFVNPTTGGYPMPTIAAFLQRLPAGFSGRRYRSTDGTIFSPTEGSGRSQIGDVSVEWKERDVFVVPPWYPVSHETEKGAVLFSFSDRAAQKALGFWREERI
jgi:gentisate 1,2-dioxygenase